MTWNAAAQSALINRKPIKRRWLFWIEAKNRSTNAVETMGLWDGKDNQEFIISGQTRDYVGALGAFQVDNLSIVPGTGIGTTTLTLPSFTAEVEQLIRGYNIKFAPCQLHLALYDDETDALLDVQRRFNGFVNGAPMGFSLGGSSSATLEMVSAARRGTNKPAAKKSDEQQKLRGGDRFRKFADVSGVAGDWWGAKKPRNAGTQVREILIDRAGDHFG